jgi:hypothetical protein
MGYYAELRWDRRPAGLLTALGRAHTGPHLAKIGRAADDKRWRCENGASQTPEHLFYHVARDAQGDRREAVRKDLNGAAVWGTRDVQRQFWSFWRRRRSESAAGGGAGG